ncbi:MAG: YIP1 family protein [Cypionkella sp.]|jgi:hypothetical protein|nr:YIP1 family protein [Cypionkella sp.]
MDLSLQNLLALARFTVQSPREGARQVMRANIPIRARWVALAITAIFSAVLAHLAMGLMPVEMRAEMGQGMSPFITAVAQAGLMLLSVHVAYWVGRWFGGTGSFEDALILMVWLQFILLILQVVQIVTQVILPPLSPIVNFASVAIFLWLLSNFVAELHGFSSVGKTFFGILATMLAVGFLLAMLLLPLMGVA